MDHNLISILPTILVTPQKVQCISIHHRFRLGLYLSFLEKEHTTPSSPPLGPRWPKKKSRSEVLQIEAIQIGHWVQQQAPANPCVGFKLFTFQNNKPWNPKTLKPESPKPKSWQLKVKITAYYRVFIHPLVISISYCLDVLFECGRTQVWREHVLAG